MSESEIFLKADNLAWASPAGEVLFSGLESSLTARITALVGPNGAGKSTLLAILAGRREPLAGTVQRRGKIGFLPQDDTKRGAERVVDLLGQGARWDALQRLEQGEPGEADVEALDGWWDLGDRLQSALDHAGLVGLEPGQCARHLSGGELTLCRLAGLLLEQPDMLFLDEPTNHLDEHARAWLYDWLARWQGRVLVVSHDRELLERVEEIVALADGRLETYGGNYTLYRDERERQSTAAAAALEHYRREKKRLAARIQKTRERHERRAARGARGRERGDMPKILLDARKEGSEAANARVRHLAQARLAAAEAKVAAASAGRVELPSLRIRPPAASVPSGKRLIAFESVRLPAGSSRYAHAERLEFVLQGPVRAWIRGPNGAGKSTLLDIAGGLREPAEGNVTRYLADDQTARLDQHALNLDPRRTVFDNFITMSGMTDGAQARNVLADFLFRGESVHRTVAILSGGERMRAALACLLYRKTPPQLLCLDEPTNHLDLESVEAVERALAGWQGAIIMLTHDLRFAASLQPNLEIWL